MNSDAGKHHAEHDAKDDAATHHDDMDDVATNDASDHADSRLDPVDGDVGMPGELIDTPANLPGDQDEDDHPPTVSEIHGRDT
ncbi:MAG: hypothetical protein ABIP17_02325 [Ilumatobacteraceae bacterium]